MKHGDLRLFALDSGREYAEAVSATLGYPLAPHEEREFEDGEHKARPLVSVRGCDVYVVESLYGDALRSVDDKLMRLLLFVGALKDSAAARVTVVAPYLAYARKDRRSKPRDPVTTRYVATLLEAMGTDCVVTIDVHNLAAYQNAFRCRCEHMEAGPLFVAKLAPRFARDDVVIVSPDAGSIKRADAFRQRLAGLLQRDVDVAFVEKYRSGSALRGNALVGEVAGKTAIIVDDLISAGDTVARAAQACRDRGAVRVIACATHGVFAGGADATLAAAPADEIFVTDTIPPLRLHDKAALAKVQQVSTVPLVAEAIARLHRGGSLAELCENPPSVG